MNISNEEYGELTKRRSHNSKLCKTVPMAFLIGGLICTLGEALLNLYGMAGLSKDDAGALTSVTLVFLSILFTGLVFSLCSVRKEKGSAFSSPGCSSIFEKSMLRRFTLGGVPVLNRRRFMLFCSFDDASGEKMEGERRGRAARG